MSMLIFGITQILPGNVAYVIAGNSRRPTSCSAIELKLGLNDPVYVQYWRWAPESCAATSATSW
jgi:peptide/nickel transport system permease protein